MTPLQASLSTDSPTEPAHSPLQSASRIAYYVGLVTVILAVVFGLATYLILTGLTPIVPTHGVVVTVLAINVGLVLAMIAIVTWQVAGLWIARKRQTAGARLHFKIVSLFSVIAMLPAVILAIFASVSLDRGLDHWFSSRTKLVVQNSLDVANAYLQEHGQVIGTDIVAMSRDIDDAAEVFKARPKRFGGVLFSQTALRNLQASFILDAEGNILVEARPQQDETPYAANLTRFLPQAAKGEVILLPPGRGNYVGALKKLTKFPDAYLFVARNVNPRVMQQLRQTQARVVEYGQLEQRRTGVQVAFGLMYVAVALTLLLAAIWIGMWFANALVAPIRRLIAASLSVSQGDLDTRVPVRSGEGDLSQLAMTFNRMTSELKNQRDELVATNGQLDERRRFTEAVLSGVTAGVLGLDAKGTITLTNPSTLALLGRPEEQLIGRPLAEAVPEFARLLDDAGKQPHKDRLSEHATISVNGMERTLALQVTRERASADRDYGSVLTFDDITELVAAQRTSAWADVARRIAHEIKNPLTPIQLSAERLRRKYGASITEDREVFERCTETIIRQVGDIGRMVDEFSSFARLPAPQMSEQDLRDIVRETAFLFQTGNSHIEIKVAVPKVAVVTLCDSRLLAQALTNMIKNATEAIASAAEAALKGANPKGSTYQGRITVGLQVVDNWIEIAVTDNGIGLPKKDRQRLVEPYMTTREKGTGIGLAVVNRVIEQHGGQLRLEDAFEADGTQRGAVVRLLLPVSAAGAADNSGDSGEGIATAQAAGIAAARSPNGATASPGGSNSGTSAVPKTEHKTAGPIA